jgi:hypothetical protein
MKNRLAMLILCLSLFAVTAQAQQVEFNYEGRVRVDGLAYTGEAYFKFAIMNASKSVALWSNDLSSVTGEEPLAAVPVDVEDGVFNVIIGDTDLPNMTALDPSSFNVRGRVFLRVWFSDVVTGPFEHLTPDRPITNPALLGSQSYSELDLFVDPVLGNDENPGTDPTRPKQTIQAAWNALPPMIQEDATIHLVDGTYREEVLLKGKTVIGDATITIQGNESDPRQVRITGSDASADTTPVRDTCFRIENQKNLAFEGILFNYTNLNDPDTMRKEAGIFATEGSSLWLESCIFENNEIGLLVENSSFVYMIDCIFDHGVGNNYGLYLRRTSGAICITSTFSNMESGVLSDRYCWSQYQACVVDNCVVGINMSISASAEFPLSTPSTVTRCTIGIAARRNSILIRAYTAVNYGSGADANGTDVEVQTGSQTWN